MNQKITPRLIEIATRNIEKLSYNIFNDYSLLEKMDEDKLEQIIIINKNKNDEIINISYNLKNAYSIINILAEKLKEDYQAIESGTVKIDYYDEELTDLNDGIILNIPIGAASDKIYLSNLGPKIPIKVKFIGTILTNLKTRVKNYGINNVLLEVYIDVLLNHEIISPVSGKNQELKYEILISAEIITGKVPTYYGGNFETKSNLLNIPLE